MGRTKRKLMALAVVSTTVAVIPVFLNAATQRVAASSRAVMAIGLSRLRLGAYKGLPLGNPGLTETRSVKTLAPGVTLTHIVRGTKPASAKAINTTPNGPWVVNVATIDSHRAEGHLTVVRGRYLTSRNTVSALVAKSGGLVGVNASYFDINDNYGVPDGLAIDNGQLIGDPGGAGHSAGPVIDSKSGTVLVNATYTWAGTVRNARTGQALHLTHIDKKTKVPAACAKLADQTRCKARGDLISFGHIWGPKTPAGHGVEVVLNSHGCVVRKAAKRGTALTPTQTAIQATGSDSAALLKLASGGCLRTAANLYANGGRVHLTRSTQATTGNDVLLRNGRNRYPEPHGDAGANTGGERNPQTAVGTSNGKIYLVTVDGRQPKSVGVNTPEMAAVMSALGARDAVQLDGGASTTMVAGHAVINHPSAKIQRPDGDALVWIP